MLDPYMEVGSDWTTVPWDGCWWIVGWSFEWVFSPWTVAILFALKDVLQASLSDTGASVAITSMMFCYHGPFLSFFCGVDMCWPCGSDFKREKLRTCVDMCWPCWELRRNQGRPKASRWWCARTLAHPKHPKAPWKQGKTSLSQDHFSGKGWKLCQCVCWSCFRATFSTFKALFVMRFSIWWGKNACYCICWSWLLWGIW